MYLCGLSLPRGHPSATLAASMPREVTELFRFSSHLPSQQLAGRPFCPELCSGCYQEKAINTSPHCGYPVWGSPCWAICSRLPVGSGPTQCHPPHPPNPSPAPSLGLSFIQRGRHLCRGWGEGQNMIVLEIWDLGGYQAPSVGGTELIPKLRGCGATTFYPAHGGPAKNALSPCDPSITVSHPPHPGTMSLPMPGHLPCF